jgi:hypothetical protein
VRLLVESLEKEIEIYEKLNDTKTTKFVISQNFLINNNNHSLSVNLKENLSEVMKLRNELLKATIFKDNHVVNYSFDDEKENESANTSPRKLNVNYLKDMDSVLEASSIIFFINEASTKYNSL